jgi:hypothetical protein
MRLRSKAGIARFIHSGFNKHRSKLHCSEFSLKHKKINAGTLVCTQDASLGVLEPVRPDFCTNFANQQVKVSPAVASIFAMAMETASCVL